MDDIIRLHYDIEGNFGIGVGDELLEMTRAEAEQLFVDIGHALKDLDTIANEKM